MQVLRLIKAFFVCSIRSLHTRWALVTGGQTCALPIYRAARNPLRFIGSLLNQRNSPFTRRKIALRLLEYNRPGFHPDARKSVVSGKSVSVRVDIGGRRLIEKKT